MEIQDRILFHRDLRSAVEPILNSAGFVLVMVESTPPESLTFERKASKQKPFARVIFHGGGLLPINQIYLQATSGDVHLIRAEDLLPEYTLASIYGGWSYKDSDGLKAVIAELTNLTRDQLLEWIEHPIPVFKEPIFTREEMLRLREALVKSIEIEEQLVARTKAEGNLKEAGKWEYSVQEKRKRIADLTQKLEKPSLD